MGSAQLLLVAGGLILLGIVSLTIYNSFGSKTDSDLYNEAYITGSGVAQSIIDQILTKSFDQNTISATITNPNSLTAVNLLGPDAGESNVIQFNDVDDYKNYSRNDTLSVMGIFHSRVDVNYATKMNPDQLSGTRTFTKRIDVFVTNVYLKDTLKFSYAKTY